MENIFTDIGLSSRYAFYYWNVGVYHTTPGSVKSFNRFDKIGCKKIPCIFLRAFDLSLYPSLGGFFLIQCFCKIEFAFFGFCFGQCRGFFDFQSHSIRKMLRFLI